MILFWTLGAALAAGALLIVLRPIVFSRSGPSVSRREANVAIYRDQSRELDADLAAGRLDPAGHERARRELEARLLEDLAQGPEGARPRGGRAMALALGAALPIAAAILYLAVGTPLAIGPPGEDPAATAAQMEDTAGRLAARLREDPEDAEGWKLLGRLLGELGRFQEAAGAYAQGALRAPRDAQLLAEFADALAMSRGERLEGEPEKLVLRALELDPHNLKALSLAGTAEYLRRDFAGAAAYWKRMLALVPPGSEDARAIQASIDDALALTGGRGRPLQGVVRLSSELEGRVDPDDTVFIFARAVDGPQIPLAVQRARAGDLPLAFSLDDSMAMAPGMTLSAHPRVIVVARVSRSGEAKAQPGDLEGASAPVASDAGGVTVLIDTAVR